MAQKQCGNCQEMVDEAKAFCPGCGNAFVEEERREASDFEKMDSTVQLGQTMYNQMLSDMGLNISKSAPPREKRIEIIEPVASAPSIKVQPPKPEPAPGPKKGMSSKTKWVVLAAAILLIGFFILIVAATILYIFWPRITQ
jgi:hypothetical protein